MKYFYFNANILSKKQNIAKRSDVKLNSHLFSEIITNLRNFRNSVLSMRQLLSFILFFVVVLGCQTSTTQAQDKPPYKYDESKIVTLPSGLKYVIIEEGKGVKPQKGDQIEAHYHGLLADGKVFDSSFDRGQTFSTAIGVGQVIRGWDEGFQLFKEGTKAVLICPPNLAYGEHARGSIPANATLYFHVQLIKVTSTPKATMQPPFDYKNLKPIEMPSGLKIYVVKEGTGATPKAGQSITAHYHGTLEDGKMFDSSYQRGAPFSTQIGVGRVIKGWDEAFTNMKVGTCATLVIPASIGYGEQGAGGVIPPNATLIFHVELMDVK